MDMTMGKLLALVKNVGGQGAGGSGGGVQPDWNQYFPDAPEYIKNRTHGLELARVVETSFSVRKLSNALADTDKRASTGQYDLVIGETYAIVVDGVTYFSECREVPVEPVTGSDFMNGTEAIRKAIGDKTFVTCPFYFYMRGNSAGTYVAERHVLADDGEHSVQIYRTYMTPQLKTLDEKYIPNTIARKSDLEGLGGGGYEFVISSNGGGLYYWAKGNGLDFINRLIDGPAPMVCIHSTNCDHEYPSVQMYFPREVAIASGSGKWCAIFPVDGNEIYIDMETGEIENN